MDVPLNSAILKCRDVIGLRRFCDDDASLCFCQTGSMAAAAANSPVRRAEFNLQQSQRRGVTP
jgi:hypothetical protein